MLHSGYIPFSILLEVWCQEHADLDTETELVCYSFVCRRTRQDPNAGNIRVAEQRKGRKRRRRTSQCSSDMELGHWVTGSMGHLGHLLCPGHWVIILTRCDTRVFPVFEKKIKNTQNAKRTLEMLKWSHCQVSAVGLKSLDVCPCNELLLLPMIIENSLAWEYFFVTSVTSLLDIYDIWSSL